MLRFWMTILRDAAPANPYGATFAGGPDSLSERLAARIGAPTGMARSAAATSATRDSRAARRPA